jgi:hypothetical protein
MTFPDKLFVTHRLPLFLVATTCKPKSAEQELALRGRMRWGCQNGRPKRNEQVAANDVPNVHMTAEAAVNRRIH